MYKNFKITDKERKQILEQHKEHGYRKPLNEASDITTNMFFKNLGTWDHIKKEVADEMREIFKDSGISTEGFSDQDMIDIHNEIKRLPNEDKKQDDGSEEINEQTLNEIGAMWLTKIKVDGHYEDSDEEKTKITKQMQRGFNGSIVVEFTPGEFFDYNGRIEDIDAYENDLNDKVYGGEERRANRERDRDRINKYHRNTPTDDPHPYRYKDFDHYKTKNNFSI
jgi:hypothetical protein